MGWKELPLALLCLSALFVALGLFGLFSAQFSWPIASFDPFGNHPEISVQLCALGAAGIAFVAYLKR